MRSLRVCIVLTLLASFALRAEAVVPPSSPPATVPPVSSDSSSAASAGSVAGAAAGASSDQKQGQGQGQRQGQTATGGTLTDSSSFRSNFYALPAPAYTPPMAKVDCPAPRIENDAVSIGWGLFSAARGRTTSDDCVLLTLSNAYIEQCQYLRAQEVRDAMVAIKLPGVTLSKGDERLINLSSEKCKALSMPPAPVTNNYYNDYSVHQPAAACPVPSKAKPTKRVVKKPVKTCS